MFCWLSVPVETPGDSELLYNSESDILSCVSYCTCHRFWLLLSMWPMILKNIHQGAKKIIFTACHSGKLKLAFTSPDIISTSPKSFLTSRIISLFFCYSNSSKDIKLKTEFNSPIAKSTSPGLSPTTFFVHCSYKFSLLLFWLSWLQDEETSSY